MIHPPLAQNSSDGVSAVNITAASNMLAGNRYPKRTRSQVKYCEIEAGESENDSESEVDEDDCPIPSKKAKIVRPGKALPKHKVFPFLDLPPEIRNKIYHECLVSDDLDGEDNPSLYFTASRRRFRHIVTRYTQQGDEAKSLTASLLATCKVVHAEAAPILYHHQFIFHDSLALMSFMSECTPQAAALIRHIKVKDWLQTRSHKNVGFLAISLLAAKGCVNLESLKIAGSLGYFHTNSWASDQRSIPMHERVARKVYREFYPWLEAVGRVSGNMYEGLAVLNIGNATWNYISPSWRTKNDQSQEEEKKTALKAAYTKALKKLIRDNWP